MRLRNLTSYLMMFVLLTGLTACLDDEVVTTEEQLEIDLNIIDSYLEENSIDAIADESGLRYLIHEEGNGASPELTDKIRVKYVGTLLGETEEFDSSDGVSFFLNQLILGWQIGFPLLQEGDTATFYIPSGLAYGTSGSRGGIPPNANLVFGVKLIEIE